MNNPEADRLRNVDATRAPWRKWGPYLSERQWGTVREDYSADGDAWNYFSHDQARSRAYRWGEDGLAGVSDEQQLLCFAVSLWNGQDTILKERLFGLTNGEGNHGEDVKEYYFYLDNTPTHSYMKYLYKYPQAAYPYNDLVQVNAHRNQLDFEYELLDTGVFNDNRYFDVFVEYAKESPEDLLIEISVVNRGPAPASLHLLPTIWFRNTWQDAKGASKPVLHKIDGPAGVGLVQAEHETLGRRYLYVDREAALLFTENETNCQRIFGTPNTSPYVKDAFHEYVVDNRTGAVNPAQTGTKAAAHFILNIAPESSSAVRLRLNNISPDSLPTAYPDGDPFGTHFDEIVHTRRQEADAFYADIVPVKLPPDAASVMRQALAGMLWGKQAYFYDVAAWLKQHGITSLAMLDASSVRNDRWSHLTSSDVISMPDKWEYPWFAAWDLAFHSIALSVVDLDFAKDQLRLILHDWYIHPNGQVPAYEWNFGDVNPPVQAWALMRLYETEKLVRGQGDIAFLEDAFHKLLLNFTWWVNRKDPDNRDVFGGGFLGLDNISVFDRSAPLPAGGHLEQSDGTAWMAFYALSMFQIAVELALHDPTYQSLAYKFYGQFLIIRYAMDQLNSGEGLWDDGDGFFYDMLRLPDGSAHPLKVRSLVGLLPLTACSVVSPEKMDRLPELTARIGKLSQNRPELLADMPSLAEPGTSGHRLLAVMDESRLRRVLARMLDENEFLSPYGVRSISRVHKDQPYVVHVSGVEYRVDYLPAESNSRMFGGNSNWRGPIWFPMNYILIRGLVDLYAYYGDDFVVDCPTGSGTQMNLWQVSQELARRLTAIFLRDKDGRRPVYGGLKPFQTDPNWGDHIFFHEYFHGDNGAGLGANHQTGWTGLVAELLHFFGSVTDFDAAISAAGAKEKSAAAGKNRPAQAQES